MKAEGQDDLTKILKYYICKMCFEASSGHPSSSLSCADIISTLHFEIMTKEDKFILSKGHAAPALYAALIINGVLSKKHISELRKIDSPMQGHPDVNRLPEVNLTSGALGQGLSFSIGLALSKKIKGENGYIYCLLGDGEIQEGQVWEASMFAGNRGIDNLIVFLDNNGGQSDGRVEEIMNLEPIAEKWKSFGWSVETINGHNQKEIKSSVTNHRKSDLKSPLMIISKTSKGYINENLNILDGQHGGSVSKEDLQNVINELSIDERSLL